MTQSEVPTQVTQSVTPTQLTQSVVPTQGKLKSSLPGSLQSTKNCMTSLQTALNSPNYTKGWAASCFEVSNKTLPRGNTICKPCGQMIPWLGLAAPGSALARRSLPLPLPWPPPRPLLLPRPAPCPPCSPGFTQQLTSECRNKNNKNWAFWGWRNK